VCLLLSGATESDGGWDRSHLSFFFVVAGLPAGHM